MTNTTGAMLAALAVTAAAVAVPSGQTSGYKPSPENLAARKWFQDARFGLFVHWGIYGQLAAGEGVMNYRAVPAADYDRVAAASTPVRFDADEWVGLAKAARMRYITTSSKHHDGGAMFDSKITAW